MLGTEPLGFQPLGTEPTAGTEVLGVGVLGMGVVDGAPAGAAAPVDPGITTPAGSQFMTIPGSAVWTGTPAVLWFHTVPNWSLNMVADTLLSNGGNDTVIAIFNAAGDLLITNDDHTGSLSSATVAVTPGTYYIAVAAFPADFGNGFVATSTGSFAFDPVTLRLADANAAVVGEASGFTETIIGSPTSFHPAPTVGVASGFVGTTFSSATSLLAPAPTVGVASGFIGTVVNSAVAFQAPPAPANWSTSALGFLATRFGAPDVFAEVSVQATGAVGTLFGSVQHQLAMGTQGISPETTFGPAVSEIGALAAGVRSTAFGKPLSGKFYQASSSPTNTRFGSNSAGHLNAYPARGVCTTRIGRPTGSSSPHGFWASSGSSTMFGSSSSLVGHTALHTAPSFYSGTPVTRRIVCSP